MYVENLTKICLKLEGYTLLLSTAILVVPTDRYSPAADVVCVSVLKWPLRPFLCSRVKCLRVGVAMFVIMKHVQLFLLFFRLVGILQKYTRTRIHTEGNER